MQNLAYIIKDIYLYVHVIYYYQRNLSCSALAFVTLAIAVGGIFMGGVFFNEVVTVKCSLSR